MALFRIRGYPFVGKANRYENLGQQEQIPLHLIECGRHPAQAEKPKNQWITTLHRGPAKEGEIDMLPSTHQRVKWRCSSAIIYHARLIRTNSGRNMTDVPGMLRSLFRRIFRACWTRKATRRMNMNM